MKHRPVNARIGDRITEERAGDDVLSDLTKLQLESTATALPNDP